MTLPRRSGDRGGGWTAADAPRQDGRIAVVTGANSGIGRETARAFAALGGHVVMACRNLEAARLARDDIARTVPGADLRIVHLDLADQASVRATAAEIAARYPGVDVLIDNAGVLRRRRELTADGFEMDFGTNVLGHFALTALLFPLLRAAGTRSRPARVVTIGSNAHRAGSLDLANLSMDTGFTAAAAYARSKLAQLLFAIELQRRLDAAALGNVISVAAHPGATETGVMRDQGVLGWLLETPTLGWLRRTFVMTAPGGALPGLLAATDPAVRGGEYYGPARLLHLSGPPVRVAWSAKATDPQLAASLWDAAEEMTGIRFAVGGA